MLGHDPIKSHKILTKQLAVWPMIGYLLPNTHRHGLCGLYENSADQHL